MIMKWKVSLSFLSAILLFTACIGDDIIADEIEPTIRITNPVDSLEINTSYTFEASAFDNTGLRVSDPNLIWTSTDPSILEIDSIGMASAKMLGTAMLSVSWMQGGESYSDDNIVTVGTNTVQQSQKRTGSLISSSSYQLEGDFNLSLENGAVVLNLESNYRASSSLPGLFVYLTNNPSTSAGALEIGPATSFSGAHSYTLPVSVGLNDYQYVLYFCKPFNVKVGDGQFDN